MPYVFLFSVANFVARLQNVVGVVWQGFKLCKHNIDCDSCSEGDHHQARGHQARDGDVRGPRELHEDEHIPWELRPLVLAKAQVCEFEMINVFQKKKKSILCVCSILFDLCPPFPCPAFPEFKILPEIFTEYLSIHYPFLQSIFFFGMIIMMTSGTRCPTDGRWRGRRTTCSGARENTRWGLVINKPLQGKALF